MNITSTERAFDAGNPAREMSEAEILQTLARVLAAPEFQGNPSATAFLKFIVEESNAGRGERLKAFAIATLALHQPESFDPQTNSLVRVQATRLRAMLEHYYDGVGAHDAIRISLPRGSYQPHFDRVGPSPERLNPKPTEPEPKDREKPLSGARVAALAMALILGFAVLWLLKPATVLTYLQGPALAKPPSVVVVTAHPERLDASGARFASALSGSIENGISAFDYVNLRQTDVADHGVAADYKLKISLSKIVGDYYDASFVLIHVDTGDTIWTLEQNGVDSADAANLAEIARRVIRSVADTSGGAVIADAISRSRLLERPLEGYSCELASLLYLRDRVEKLREKTRNCLERALNEDPNDVRAMEVLSARLIIDYMTFAPDSRAEPDLRRALELAARAYVLAPQRASAQTALFFARFHNRSFDDALEAAQRAIATNPNDSFSMARIARGYISRERYQEGLELVAPLERSPSGQAAGLQGALTLVALMLGNDDLAYRYATRDNGDASLTATITKIIACNRKGDMICKKEAEARLTRAFPGFVKNVAAGLARFDYSNKITTRLLDDLSAAGLGEIAG